MIVYILTYSLGGATGWSTDILGVFSSKEYAENQIIKILGEDQFILNNISPNDWNVTEGEYDGGILAIEEYHIDDDSEVYDFYKKN